jgi:hypothetical protein
MYKICLIILLAFSGTSYGQAFFTSQANGDWNSPTTWTLAAGVSALNYPTTGDSVIIQNANVVSVTGIVQCQSVTIKGTSVLNISSTNAVLNVGNDMLVTESSQFNMTNGLAAVTGNVTVNQKASFNQSGGAFNVVGLVFLTAPITSGGNTTLTVDGGFFTCIGGLTITATVIPAGRIAELKIGNGAATVVGALTTVSANAKISFTGAGALTLAGIVSISNASSFAAGNGRVVYVGIPGSNQTVASLTYNRLVITGIGSGSKTVNGNVLVTDSLILLSDTLVRNAAGSLSLNSNATIVKTAGKILFAPLFLGTVNLVYNNVQRDTTGFEMPASPGILQDLTINDVAGVALGADVTVNNQLALQNGELNTNNFGLTIANPNGGASSDPAIARTNGYVNGRINRVIGTNVGLRTFPFGIGIIQGDRAFNLNYTSAPTSPGVLSVQHFNSPASSQTGLPLSDAGTSLTSTEPYYWQAEALNGLTGGLYDLVLTAQSATSITDYMATRIVKRPSSGGDWLLDGTAGSNSGSNFAPVVARTGMSGFSQFALAYNSASLPLTLLRFSVMNMNGKAFLSWSTANEINTAFFVIEKSADAMHFASLATVESTKVPGLQNEYAYADANPSGGINYFRLRITDRDGRFSYSPVVSIRFENKVTLKLYPTLATSSITVVAAPGEEISLYNSQGILLNHLRNGVNDISELSAGFYIVSTGRERLKFIKR